MTQQLQHQSAQRSEDSSQHTAQLWCEHAGADAVPGILSSIPTGSG